MTTALFSFQDLNVTSPLSSFVSLDKLLKLSELHLLMGIVVKYQSIKLLRGLLNKMIHIKAALFLEDSLP